MAPEARQARPNGYFVHVRLDRDQYDWLQQAAQERRTGMATVVRQAIDLMKRQPATTNSA